MSATEATSVLLIKGISSYMQRTLIRISGPSEMKKNNYNYTELSQAPSKIAQLSHRFMFGISRCGQDQMNRRRRSQERRSTERECVCLIQKNFRLDSFYILKLDFKSTEFPDCQVLSELPTFTVTKLWLQRKLVYKILTAFPSQKCVLLPRQGTPFLALSLRDQQKCGKPGRNWDTGKVKSCQQV